MTDRDGCTPLYCAAAWNRVAAVRLLERLQCPSTLRSLEGRTAVHVAAEQGWVELIDVLVRDLGAAADARDNYQFTPLHSAANGGHVEAIGRLAALAHDLDARDYLGACLVAWLGWQAVWRGRLGCCRAGAGPLHQGVRCSRWQPQPHAAASLCCPLCAAGRTPLHYAAMHGRLAALDELARLGADLHLKDSRGGYAGGCRGQAEDRTVLL